MIKFKKHRILALVMAAMLALSVTGCKDNKDESTHEDRPDITIGTGTTSATEEVVDDPDFEDPTGGALFETDVDPFEEDPASAEAIAEQERFAEYLEEEFKLSVVSDTLTLHYNLAHPEDYGIEEYDITYGDVDFSDEATAEDKKETEEYIEEINGYDSELLTIEQRFTKEILLRNLENNLWSYDFEYLYEPFAYTSGLQANLPITMAEYIFYDEQDVKDYLALLETTPEYFEAWLDYEREKSARGLFMNQNSASEVIRQCSDFIAATDNNVLIATFDSRIAALDGIADADKQAYMERNKDIVLNTIIPTYENVIAVFEELKDTGKNEWGLCYLENGKEYYKYLMASRVGTTKTPEEIIDAIDDAISSTMTELQLTAMADYEAYTAYLDEMDDFYKGEDYVETIRYFEDVFDEKFPDIPEIDFTVAPVHESLEDSVSPAFYMTPPLDAYTSNSIHINEGGNDTGAVPWSTLAHEGVPGHMYQFVYFLSSNPEPIRTLLSFNGYSEGWAQYIENMSFEYYEGYSNPVFADFERINAELNVLVSARVEIGVNYEGWKLEETQEYLSENGFNSDVAQDIIDYVVAEPGNYQMYCFGWLEIEELREFSERALGDDFDEKEFHKAILDAGPCPFDLLRARVEKYVARELAE